MNRGLEALLGRDRLVVAGALVVVSLLSWGWMLAGAGMGMSGIEMTRHSLMKMDMTANARWDLAYATLMFFMWWIMMVAMMLPSATPVILLAAALNRRSDPERKPYGATAAFTSGYLLAWAGFSLVAVAAQWALQAAGLINTMMQSLADGLTASILVVAGAWQFTPWKYACLRHCRGPVEFLTQFRRPGHTGALRMGAHHGLYCLGCCWFLMALLFVGGVMNLFWIAGLAIYVWVEKLLPGGELAARIMGAALIAWGLTVLVL